jgi:LmbE family N-acetylglucosaminyl deacetylase
MPSGPADTVDFLADADSLPLLPPETVRSWGKTLVVAPHPDDETLGCGGAIALLRRFGLPVSVLGADASAPTFLRLPDGAVPTHNTPGFTEAATQCHTYLADGKPQTILLPWRRDPHPDHRAVSQITQAALSQLAGKPRLLEYPVWAWERAAPEDVPQPQEARAFRLDIREAADVKQAAVAAHQSQVTHLIDDDPHGFWLSPEVLAHFARPWEVYLEVLSW